MLNYMTKQGWVAKENVAVWGLLREHAKPQLVQLEELQPSAVNMWNVSAVAAQHLSNAKLNRVALQSLLVFQ